MLQGVMCHTPFPRRWTRQRERVEQLTLQAVYNVSQQSDEFVKEYLASQEKVQQRGVY